MFWLLTSLLMAQEDNRVRPNEKVVYVAPVTINDPTLEIYEEYINSLVVSAAGVKSRWTNREAGADNIVIHDSYSIETAEDTVCNYSNPLECGRENLHWVLLTEISSVQDSAIIKLKLYDEDSKLVSNTDIYSYPYEQCIATPEIAYDPRDIYGLKKDIIEQYILENCKMLDLKILQKDITAAVTMLFAKVEDRR